MYVLLNTETRRQVADGDGDELMIKSNTMKLCP